MSIGSILNQIIPMFVVMAIGYAMRRFNMVPKSFRKNLSAVCVDVLIPGIIIYSVCVGGNGADIFESLRIVAAGAVCLLASMAAAAAICRFMTKNTDEFNMLWMVSAFSNFGLVGYTLVANLFGSEALFNASMFLLPCMLAMNSITVIMLQRGKGGKIDFKAALLSPPVITSVIAVIILILRIPLPTFVVNTVTHMSKALTPAGMLLVGMSMMDYGFEGMFSDARVYVVTALRLAVMPLMCFGINLAMGLTGFEALSGALPLAVPAPINTVILAERFNGDTKMAARLTLMTTVFSIVTMPLLSYMLAKFIGV